MKVRGGRRRLHARVEQAWRGVREPIENLRQVLVRIEIDVRAFAEAMNRMARQIRVSIWLTQKRAHDQWVARHAIPAAPAREDVAR